MRMTGPYQPGRAELSHVQAESLPLGRRNQSPKKGLSQSSKKGVTEITYKFHTDGVILLWFSNHSLPHRHSGTSQCSHDGTMVLPYQQESSFWACLSSLPYSSPWNPSIDVQHPEIYIKCPLTISVSQRHPTYDLSPPKRFEKMPIQLHWTLRPAASVTSWNPNWHWASPLWRVNRATTKGMNCALQTTGCFETMKCICYNWQCLTSEKNYTERVIHFFNGEISEEWWS